MVVDNCTSNGNEQNSIINIIAVVVVTGTGPPQSFGFVFRVSVFFNHFLLFFRRWTLVRDVVRLPCFLRTSDWFIQTLINRVCFRRCGRNNCIVGF